MTRKEILIHFIKNRGSCAHTSQISCARTCPLAKIISRGHFVCGISTNNEGDLLEGRYLKAIELFIKEFGKEELLEVLL